MRASAADAHLSYQAPTSCKKTRPAPGVDPLTPLGGGASKGCGKKNAGQAMNARKNLALKKPVSLAQKEKRIKQDGEAGDGIEAKGARASTNCWEQFLLICSPFGRASPDAQGGGRGQVRREDGGNLAEHLRPSSISPFAKGSHGLHSLGYLTHNLNLIGIA